VNRNLSASQCLEFLLIVIDEYDLMTEIGETGSRYQSDISRSHYRDLHPTLPTKMTAKARKSYCSSFLFDAGE
jgi:hypothetical protein